MRLLAEKVPGLSQPSSCELLLSIAGNIGSNLTWLDDFDNHFQQSRQSFIVVGLTDVRTTEATGVIHRLFPKNKTLRMFKVGKSDAKAVAAISRLALGPVGGLPMAPVQLWPVTGKFFPRSPI